MNLDPIINALAIPREALVEQRVPKKLLMEQGAPTTADKRQIQEGIEEMFWVAALKPNNIGVPAFRDGVREYLEIAVLSVVLRAKAKLPRLTELIHRAIPYPVVLVTAHSGTANLSLAHKRWSQGEAGKVVIEGVRQVPLSPDSPSTEEAAFLSSLAVSLLPAADLFTMYEGILSLVISLEAAKITGSFRHPASGEQVSATREGIDRHTQLKRDIAFLRARAQKEKQLNRRVELNLEIQRLENQLKEVIPNL
jgi:hypothetical protein